MSTTSEYTKADYVTVGKYTKATDPEMVTRLRHDGHKTTAEAIGRYVHDVDADMFADLHDYLAADA